ncbi:SARP family transcriptional regulator [Micromonospora sp. AKA38]|nr:SARP family transcriptional regulator [Micromonospora sp. AKA38]
MQFRLLGPVELWEADQRVDIGPMKQRAVLAALLVDAGRPISPDVLTDRVWGDKRPAQVRNVLHTYVTRLRSVFARLPTGSPGRRPQLLKQPAGYVLDLDARDVDLLLFRSRVGEAAAARTSQPDRARLLREAIDLWRGEPLAGVAGEWATQTRDAWQMERCGAVAGWARTSIDLGQGAEAVGPLEDLCRQHPFNESTLALLMRAMHAAGRDSAALDRYTAIRRVFAEELGMEPGPELQQVHQAILRGELPSTDPKPEAVAQIPTGLTHFVGRESHLSRLAALFAEAENQPTATMIATIHGTAGVGKTTLAVHWARQNADRFPDGQLYVDLHGFSADSTIADPATVLRGFLEALGTLAGRIPAGLDDRAAMYRSLMSGRRTLVVLDNARDAEQVRPLLPGAPSCVTLITSRNPLAGLVVTYGAQLVCLDLLDDGEARSLVVDRIGAARGAQEPQLLTEMIARCAGLSLALAVLGSRMAMRPDVPLAVMAAELRETGNALDAFASDDPATDARSVLSWSYRILSAPAARLFRLLGVHPGEDITANAMASLLAVPVPAVRVFIRELTTAQLLSEHRPGRYKLHDLLQAYAVELAGTEESAAEQHLAERRLFDHYLHTSCAARIAMSPYQLPRALGEPSPGTQVAEILDHAGAMAWFAAEHRVLMSTLRRAAESGAFRHVWLLGWSLSTFLIRGGYWQDHQDAMKAALDAAVRHGDRAGEALVLLCTAMGLSRIGKSAEARINLERAVRLQAELEDRSAEANIHGTLASVLTREGAYPAALREGRLAADLYRAAGNTSGEAAAWGSMAWTLTLMGRPDSAIEHGLRALSLSSAVEDPNSQAATWHTIGYAQHQLGRFDDARRSYEESLALLQRGVDRYNNARVLVDLGDVRHATNDHEAASVAWLQALKILVDLGYAEAADVRRKLMDLRLAMLRTGSGPTTQEHQVH